MKYSSIKYFVATLLAALFLLVPTAITSATPTDTSGTCGTASGSAQDQILQGVGEGAQTNSADCSGSGVESTVRAIVNILSLLVGIVAVIMVIVGGFSFVTSGGESNKVASAKNTIVYALIGLVIVALAQVIVHFVLTSVLTGNVTAG